MELRAYQRQALDALYAFWEQRPGNPLIVAPCGAGKSVIIAAFIREAMAYPDTRILMLTHRRELLTQNAKALTSIWPDAPIGFWSAGLNKKEGHAPILFAGIQSVSKHLDSLPPFELCLIDESHLIPRRQRTQYGQAIAALTASNPDIRFIGLTATPYRLDSGLLHEGEGALFDGVAYEIPVLELIRQGHLCEVVGKRGIEVADLSKVHQRGGEFIAGEMAGAFDIPRLVQSACDEIVRYGESRRAWLVFAASIQHAKHIRDALRQRGVEAEMVSGQTPAAERDRLLDNFKAGRLRCLVNCDILTIGFDAPICDMGVLLRATASTALYVQIVGRLMRTYPGKSNALLLDFGGNVERHGPIDRVKPKAPGKGTGDTPAKACPQCHSLVHTAVKACPDCGYEWPPWKPNHNATAYNGAVMSHQSKGEWVDVQKVTYSRHKKAGRPDSVRVEYQAGLRTYSDWWTPEHLGYPRSKTIRKLLAMGQECPTTTEELLKLALSFPIPEAIYIKPDGKYERVERVRYPQ